MAPFMEQLRSPEDRIKASRQGAAENFMKDTSKRDIAGPGVDPALQNRVLTIRPVLHAMGEAGSPDDGAYPEYLLQASGVQGQHRDGARDMTLDELKERALASLQTAIAKLGSSVLAHHQLHPYDASQLAIFLWAVNASASSGDREQLLRALQELVELLVGTSAETANPKGCQ